MDFPGHFQNIFKELNHQRLRAQLCDCVVLIGGRSFPAHRSILAACSSHFKALLSSGDSGDETEVQICGQKACPGVMELDPGVVTADAFSTLLDMIYTSNLSLTATNVMDVLLAASYLHLNTVVKACKNHLSKKNFPTSPPKGWRSMQQHATSVGHRDGDVGEVGAEVSQSSGQEDPNLKRKSDQRGLHDGTKRSRRQPGCSPGTIEGQESLVPSDCLKIIDGSWKGRCEEVETKYAKGELEEIELPSQSDSSTSAAGMWQQPSGESGDNVVKVKICDEGENDGGESTMLMVEVKKENQSSYPFDIDTASTSSPPFPPKDFLDNSDTHFDVAKMTHTPMTSATEADVGSVQSQLCPDLQSDTQGEVPDLGEESADADEGLESLSELAFSCFLNPSSDSVLGALEDDTSLASLTAAVTAAAAAASDVPTADCEEPCEKSEPQSSSSLVFPVSSVPMQQQQLLQTQSCGFTDTVILQPTQNSLTGFLSGPGLCVKTSLLPQTSTGKSIGGKNLRRIAPKVTPGSETDTDTSTALAGDEVDRPSLTRASEDVLQKCKKAAAEDHVLLVEGEKKYACKICCKTFISLTDCKKHIRVHTGEKPYPCPKCGKRFSQSSHLYKHSKNTCFNWKDAQSLPDMTGTA